ncbi:MAG: SDR family NAD(P)-dependent oxidoreductase [Zoogloeaceae bacterium]|nr:SDR family NAD(P)-dependent oxidoreductase [Zoogloeaceae bacterium]
MSKSIHSRVWFITGASRGFGLETARAALARGDRVVATARKPESITAVLGEHQNLLPVGLDVTDEAQAVAAARAAVERFGRIDVLLNNAGFGLLGAVEEASASEVERVYATNVFGLLKVTRAVLPHMRRARGGLVINISSIGGYWSYPGWTVYGSTKFAVEGLSEGLARELAPLGIRVTCVQPGFFRTDFLDSSSLSSTATQIDDYAATVGAMRQHAAGANHRQPGDPLKLVQALLQVADSSEPPLRLPLGSDAVAQLEEKLAIVAGELARWRAVSLSTDHDDVAA